MADQTQSPGFLAALANYLRSMMPGVPSEQDKTGRLPLEQQRDGYRLHVQEAQAQGEKPLPYEEWLAQQPKIGAQSR